MGDVFEVKGYFKGGVLEGYGETENLRTREISKGFFWKGKKDGYCIQISGEKSSEFKGDFEDNLRHGFGQLLSPEYDYTGFWEHGQRSNFAHLKKGGSTFFGEFKRDLRNGVGEESNTQSGETFVGNFQNNYRRGFGAFKNSEYSYKGNWINGKRSGLGFFRLNKTGKEGETTYFGHWKNDTRSGLGVFTSGNQQIRAEWLDDVLHGRVCIGASSKNPIFMRYEHGQAVEELTTGLGSFLALFVPLDFNRFTTFVREKETQIKELIESAKTYNKDYRIKLTNLLTTEHKRLKMDLEDLKTRYYNLDIALSKLQHKLLKGCQEKGVNISIVKSLSESGKPLIGVSEVLIQSEPNVNIFDADDDTQENKNYNTQTMGTLTMHGSEELNNGRKKKKLSSELPQYSKFMSTYKAARWQKIRQQKIKSTKRKRRGKRVYTSYGDDDDEKSKKNLLGTGSKSFKRQKTTAKELKKQKNENTIQRMQNLAQEVNMVGLKPTDQDQGQPISLQPVLPILPDEQKEPFRNSMLASNDDFGYDDDKKQDSNKENIPQPLMIINPEISNSQRFISIPNKIEEVQEDEDESGKLEPTPVEIASSRFNDVITLQAPIDKEVKDDTVVENKVEPLKEDLRDSQLPEDNNLEKVAGILAGGLESHRQMSSLDDPPAPIPDPELPEEEANTEKPEIEKKPKKEKIEDNGQGMMDQIAQVIKPKTEQVKEEVKKPEEEEEQEKKDKQEIENSIDELIKGHISDHLEKENLVPVKEEKPSEQNLSVLAEGSENANMNSSVKDQMKVKDTPTDLVADMIKEGEEEEKQAEEAEPVEQPPVKEEEKKDPQPKEQPPVKKEEKKEPQPEKQPEEEKTDEKNLITISKLVHKPHIDYKKLDKFEFFEYVLPLTEINILPHSSLSLPLSQIIHPESHDLVSSFPSHFQGQQVFENKNSTKKTKKQIDQLQRELCCFIYNNDSKTCISISKNLETNNSFVVGLYDYKFDLMSEAMGVELKYYDLLSEAQIRLSFSNKYIIWPGGSGKLLLSSQKDLQEVKDIELDTFVTENKSLLSKIDTLEYFEGPKKALIKSQNTVFVISEDNSCQKINIKKGKVIQDSTILDCGEKLCILFIEEGKKGKRMRLSVNHLRKTEPDPSVKYRFPTKIKDSFEKGFLMKKLPNSAIFVIVGPEYLYYLNFCETSKEFQMNYKYNLTSSCNKMMSIEHCHDGICCIGELFSLQILFNNRESRKLLLKEINRKEEKRVKKQQMMLDVTLDEADVVNINGKIGDMIKNKV